MKKMILASLIVFPIFASAQSELVKFAAQNELTVQATSLTAELSDDSSGLKRTGPLNRDASVKKMMATSGSTITALNLGKCVQMGSYYSSGCAGATSSGGGIKSNPRGTELIKEIDLAEIRDSSVSASKITVK